MTEVSELDELSAATAAAAVAAPDVARASTEARAAWLRAVAATIDDHADELIEIAQTETHLGYTRLVGEVTRTTGQLRLFAEVISEGSYLEATIDHAVSTAVPPRPDLRRVLRPIGPVAVFSASNFPFAFSVAGGDTASALAVGCPVVVKAHPGHLALSRRTADLVKQALEAAGAPAGTFALVCGLEAGRSLVIDPVIKAVSFTGSVSGGRALYDLVASRPDPIPFYGELGSVNPVVVTSGALSARRDELVSGLVASFTLGAGQFCTKPGVILVPGGAGFESAVGDATEQVGRATLLTDRIADAFSLRLSELAADAGVTVMTRDIRQPDAASGATPVVLATQASTIAAHPENLLEECFGPVTLLVSYGSERELLDVLRMMPGSLTATVHSQPEDDVASIVELLADRAGRVLFNDWPTGVAVNWAQHHGGPWPATTSVFTSVGATAVRRFQRPVAYQGAPASVLPASLHDENPLAIPRRIDGQLTLP